MPDPSERAERPTRTAPREVTELRAIAARQPELAGAAAMHIEIAEMYRRIQGRVPLPWFELGKDSVGRHSAEARPLLRFEDIPIELTDLRLLVRQTADIMRRHDALDESDYQTIQTIGRDTTLLAVVGHWYRTAAERHMPAGAAAGAGAGAGPFASAAPIQIEASVLDQVLSIAMRPFLSRCAEVLQQRTSLNDWVQPYCALCGADPDFAVITPAAERHLICSRCTLQWKFEPLTCPYCRNSDRSRITSFATPDGQYRVYACDVCQRYLKAYDGRRATRPVMPVVDSVATLPLDAAAMQRGYS